MEGNRLIVGFYLGDRNVLDLWSVDLQEFLSALRVYKMKINFYSLFSL